MLADSDTDGISHTPRSTMNRCLRIISTRSPAASGTTVIAQRRIRKTLLRKPHVIRKLAARERQRDKQLGTVTRWLSWPAVVLAGGVLLSLAANLPQAQPTAWGRVVAAVPSVAFLVAVSMIERRAARRAS